MYEWKFLDDDVRDAAGSLPTAGVAALMELLVAAQLDQWGVADRSPGDPNMPNVAFGPHGAGIVSLLILDEVRQVWVTRVQWAG